MFVPAAPQAFPFPTGGHRRRGGGGFSAFSREGPGLRGAGRYSCCRPLQFRVGFTGDRPPRRGDRHRLAGLRQPGAGGYRWLENKWASCGDTAGEGCRRQQPVAVAAHRPGFRFGPGRVGGNRRGRPGVANGRCGRTAPGGRARAGSGSDCRSAFTAHCSLAGARDDGNRKKRCRFDWRICDPGGTGFLCRGGPGKRPGLRLDQGIPGQIK